MKKILYPLMIAIVFKLIFSGAICFAGSEPSIVGEAGILLDTKSGEILYAKNAFMQRYPASTTKILTSIIAIEKGDLNETVITGKNAEGTDGTSIWLKEGEKQTLENLLYAILLNSANDACVVVAEHLSGSVEEFSKLMNQKAEEIGAKSSHFVNPNGLPDDDHYTTAYDLALIARYAMQNETFRNFVSTKTRNIPWGDNEWDRSLVNGNKLLGRYDGAIGVKTGYTLEAQQCLVASARRGERELLSVVLGSQGENIWTDSTALLDYGFDNFDLIKIVEKGETAKELPVKNGKPNGVLLITSQELYHSPSRGETLDINVEYELPGEIVAPVQNGQELGRAIYFSKDNEIGSVILLAAQDIPKNKHLLLIVMIIFLFITAIIFLEQQMRKQRYKKRKLKKKAQLNYYR